MAYVIDVYRGRIPAEQSLLRLGTYLTMFPQLISGPITNYADVRVALGRERTIKARQLEEGMKLLIIGLAAKVVIADRIGTLWNSIRMIGFDSISTKLAWMGAFAYSLQLYFDFAGYSMMARGIGKMLGFELPVNFRYPYISKSVTEFWRRWHITLGRWFREYVYIPLGGNRKGKARTFFNLFVVWSLTALWHGANYNFLIWGGILLCCLLVEKLFLLRLLDKSRVIGHLYVSVLGGNTANSEFEYLTGDSMAFLPSGSIPYQQYLNKYALSIVSHMKELGYSTTAMHPYNASGWNRSSVYELSLIHISEPTRH